MTNTWFAINGGFEEGRLQAKRPSTAADQRRRAGHALTSDALEEWHRYSLPAFTERMKSRLRSHYQDGHQAWPANGRHTRHMAEACRRSRDESFALDVAAVRHKKPAPSWPRPIGPTSSR
jgi:hypothetical protein